MFSEEGDLVMASTRQVGQVKHNARKLLVVELSFMIILLGGLKKSLFSFVKF